MFTMAEAPKAHLVLKSILSDLITREQLKAYVSPHVSPVTAGDRVTLPSAICKLQSQPTHLKKQTGDEKKEERRIAAAFSSALIATRPESTFHA